MAECLKYNDRALLYEGIKNENSDAFRCLYRFFEAKYINWAAYKAPDLLAISKDLFTDSMMSLYKNIRRGKMKNKSLFEEEPQSKDYNAYFDAYFWSIFRNTLMKAIGTNRKEQLSVSELKKMMEIEDFENDGLTSSDNSSVKEISVRACVDELDDYKRKIITEKFGLDDYVAKDNDAVAQLLGVENDANFRKAVSNAYLKIKNCMQKKGFYLNKTA